MYSLHANGNRKNFIHAPIQYDVHLLRPKKQELQVKPQQLGQNRSGPLRPADWDILEIYPDYPYGKYKSPARRQFPLRKFVQFEVLIRKEIVSRKFIKIQHDPRRTPQFEARESIVNQDSPGSVAGISQRTVKEFKQLALFEFPTIQLDVFKNNHFGLTGEIASHVRAAFELERLHEVLQSVVVTEEQLRSNLSFFWQSITSAKSINVQEAIPGLRGEKTRLRNALCAAFEAEPFEAGIAHRAEQIIGKALLSIRSLSWLREFCTDKGNPSFAASVLCCLGRHSRPGTTQWRTGLIGAALAIDDVEIRDAAVQAVESWGGEDLLEILKSHQEPESWMRDYIQAVIEDLGT